MLKVSKGRQLVLIFYINSTYEQTQHIRFNKTIKSTTIDKHRSALKFFKQSGASETAGSTTNLVLKHRIESSSNKGYNRFLEKGIIFSRLAYTPTT